MATIGDLLDDIVVRLNGPLNVASDTDAEIARRRGGSAANFAATAAGLGTRTRFLGQVGDDPMGVLLVAELAGRGVDTHFVRRSGITGTIVVLVDSAGERSMLTDRKASIGLVDPERRWLDNVSTLHVPLYSLVDQPLSDSARTLIEWAHEDGIAVSVDLSSVALIEQIGVSRALQILGDARPTVVFANEDEARLLDINSELVGALTVVKRGSQPARIFEPGQTVVEIPACSVDVVSDTTGAGDAFAGGFLSHGDGGSDHTWLREPHAATDAGHRAAAGLLAER